MSYLTKYAVPCVPVAPTFACARAARGWEFALPSLWRQYYEAFSRIEESGGRGGYNGGESGSVCEDIGSVDGDERCVCRFRRDRLQVDVGVARVARGCDASLESFRGNGGSDKSLVEVGSFVTSEECTTKSKGVVEADGVQLGSGIGGGGGIVEEHSQCDALLVGKQSKKNAKKRARAKREKLSQVGYVGGEPQVVADVCEVKGLDSSVSDQAELSVVSGGSVVRGVSYKDVTTVGEQKEFARQWYERKCVENRLAIQRAKYNVKRNEYLDRSRISEQRWETERLNCDAKLARISAARLGRVVGSVETVVSAEERSLRPPSLSTGSDSPAEFSDGTVSPDSSISVAEGVRLSNKVKELESENAEVKLKYEMLVKAVSMGGSKIVIDGKNIHEYDGTGQYVPPFDDEVESLYDGRGHLLDAWEAGLDY